MKKLVLIVLLALGLSACDGGKQQVCTYEQSGITSKLVHKHSGDVIKSTKETLVFTYADLGIAEDGKKDFQKQVKETYDSLYGTSNTSYKEGKDTFTVVLSVVYNKKTIEELQKTGVVDAGNATYISLEQSIQHLENAGYVCHK